MFNSNAKYWIWLTLALGYNNPKYKKLFGMYNNIKNFYLDGTAQWLLTGIFTAADLDCLEKANLKEAEEILEKCKKYNYNIITIEDNEYPEDLKEIYAPPAVLYTMGKIPDFSNLSVSIVGTRKASSYGVKSAFEIAYNLSKAGTIIISGGALGVDCAAHQGALHSNGVTVAVLGCGINYRYLSENAAMRKAITQKGVLISEYPPDYPALPYNFPARNRIISALSNGVLVIEAGIKSGSLITVNFALEQGKDVFAVMGNINSEESKGSNKLIKDGAVPVTSYEDILQFYFLDYNPEKEENNKINENIINKIPTKAKTGFNDFQKINKESKNEFLKPKILKPAYIKKKENIDASELARKIYDNINIDPIHVDEIAEKLDLPVFKILQGVSELELLGVIETLKGRMYKII